MIVIKKHANYHNHITPTYNRVILVICKSNKKTYQINVIADYIVYTKLLH